MGSKRESPMDVRRVTGRFPDNLYDNRERLLSDNNN